MKRVFVDLRVIGIFMLCMMTACSIIEENDLSATTETTLAQLKSPPPENITREDAQQKYSTPQFPKLMIQTDQIFKANSVAFSPNWRYFASSDNLSIKFWDLRAGRLLYTLKEDVNEGTFHMAFSPDEELFAISANDTIRLWEVRTGKKLHTLTGHSGYVNSAAFSPDGQVLVSGSNDGTIKLWNVRIGKELRTFTRHSEYINSVVFSPDGKFLASGGGNDHTVRLWDIRIGRELFTLTGHKYVVRSVMFSPNGQLLASNDGATIRLWDVRTGETIRIFTRQSEGVFFTMAFSPNGQFLAGRTGDFIKLWDVQTGRLLRTLISHSDRVYSVAFNPNGQFLAGSDDHTIKIWNADTGQEVASLTAIDEHDWAVVTPQNLFDASPAAMQWMHWVVDLKPIEFNQLKDRYYEPGLLSKLLGFNDEPLREVLPLEYSDMDSDIKFVTTDSPELSDTQQPELVIHTGHSDNISSVTFSSDGQFLASGSKDHTIKLWDVHTGKPLRTLRGHTHEITSVEFSPTDPILVSRDVATFKLWDVRNSRELLTWTGQHQYSSRFNASQEASLAFSPNGNFLAGSDGPTIKLWDVRTGKLLRTITTEYSGHVTFSPDGRLLASGRSNVINVWEVYTGKLLHTFTEANVWVRTLTFSPDGLLLASGDNFSIKLWDVRTGTLSRKVSAQSGRSFNAVGFRPDGQLLVGSDGSTIRLWNIYTGKMVGQLSGHTGQVNALSFNSDGRFLASGSDDLTVRLWDIETKTILRSLTGRSGRISSAVFSLDGQLIASGDDNGLVKIWNLHAGKVVQTLPDHTGRISALSFSQDGKLLIASDREMCKLWEIHTGKLLHTFRGSSDALAFSANGHLLASHRGVWDVITGHPLHTFAESFASAYTVVFHGNRPLVADGKDGMSESSIDLWDLSTGKVLYTLIDPSESHVAVYNTMMSSQDARLLASSSVDHSIQLWDLDTRRLRQTFKGHTGLVHSLALSSDRQFLASGGDDRTVKLWNTQTGQLLQTFTGHADDIETVTFSPDGRLLASGSLDGSLKLWDIQQGRELATFVAIDTDGHVIATPQQYYMASKGALSGIAFRVGNNVFPFEQFDLRLNRPDLVLRHIGSAPQELIETYYKAYQKRLKNMEFTEEMLGDDFHLPEVEILNSNTLPLSTPDKHLTFSFKATDTKYLLDRLNIFVNDVPVYGIDGINLRSKKISAYEQKIALELSNSRNKIQVSVLNQQGAESLKETFEIEYTGTPTSPELYVVAVGVSEYADTNRNLKYAAKDASDLVSFFQQHHQNFGSIHVTTIPNTNATKENILAVKELLQHTKVDDQVILFFAGHGLLDDQFDYYFATTDIDFNKPSERGLPYEAIEGLLDGIPARKKLLLMDTCHSGEVDKEDVQVVAAAERSDIENPAVQARSFRGLGRVRQRQLGLQNSFELLRELFVNLQRGSGAIVISSASGLEFAYESGRYRNGLFTYALLEGLRGQADTNADQVIQVSELRDYVTGKVQKLSKNHQTPTVRRENLEFDFRLVYTR